MFCVLYGRLLFFWIFSVTSSTVQKSVENRRNCHDLWLHHQIRSPGLHQVDVDGPGNLNPIWVYCDVGLGQDISEVYTVVHHNTEKEFSVWGKEQPGSYSKNISYGFATEAHLAVLIDSHYSCQQHIKWQCKGAMFTFWYPPGLDSWWVGRGWRDQFYWGGAETDSHSCGCHPYCIPTKLNSTCNCDINDKHHWLEDSGLLLDAARLPVLQLRFGDTGETSEAGSHTLGPLICRATGHKDEFMGRLVAPVTFSSPLYPHRYPPPFRRYHWTIDIPEGKNVEVVFPDYDMLHWGAYNSVPGCKDAMVITALRASDGKFTRIKRQKAMPPYMISDGSQTSVNISMITCNQVPNDTSTHRGFMVTFRETRCPGCNGAVGHNGSVTWCNMTCGVIASAGYPFPHLSYEKPLGPFKETWHITVSEEFGVQFKFNDFDVLGTPGARNCTKDWGIVTFYEGLYPIPANDSENVTSPEKIVELCNYNVQGIVTSRGNIMTVVYETKRKKFGNGRGFHGTFDQIEPSKLIEVKLHETAQDKPASQSSIRSNFGPSLAVDDNPYTCAMTDFQKEPWLRIDLQKTYRVHEIEIRTMPAKQLFSPQEPIKWPSGSYGLPMAASGCPSSEGFEWFKGFRYHDVEYPVIENDKVQYASDGIKLAGGFQPENNGILQRFCIKMANMSESSTTEWSPGNYCIYKVGKSCPNGFQTGQVTWIDRYAHLSPSRNSLGGHLPAGNYTAYNTTISFCCRSDGNTEIPIILPRDQPFILMQNDISTCQKVEGMSVREQWLYFVEEETEKNAPSDTDSGGMPKFQGMHPRADTTLHANGMRIYYCYYDIVDGLRGFRVLLDQTGLQNPFSRIYDERHYGIPRTVTEEFHDAYACVTYDISNPDFEVKRFKCYQSVDAQYVMLQIFAREDALRLCDFKVFAEESCGQALGMASEEIYDDQIYASSNGDNGLYHCTNARLNSNGVWCSELNDPQKEITVDLKNHTTITGVILQGVSLPTKHGYVRLFQLFFSNDSFNWVSEEQPVGKIKTYVCKQCESATYSPETPIRYKLLQGFEARYVKLKIIEYYRAPCLRIELIGCRSNVACGGVLQEQGVVKSPNYPLYYGQDRDCWWTIKPEYGKHVWLNFVVYDIAIQNDPVRFGACRDALRVFPSDKNTSIVIESPSDHFFPKDIISDGELRIHLRSCLGAPSGRHRGFYAKFHSTKCAGCGIGDYSCYVTHRCTSICGNILSIEYPRNYRNDHRCSWLIVAPSENYINMSFHDFDVVGGDRCEGILIHFYISETSLSATLITKRPGDYVELYDGSDHDKETLIGRYCDTAPPPAFIVSSWNQLRIEFTTDGETVGRGFHIGYNALRFQLPDTLKRLDFYNPQECPANWLFYNDHCYNVYHEQEPLQWYEAEGKCAALGKGRNGHLISILDQREMAVVHYFLTALWKVHETSLYIGLTDAAGEGSYRWSDGNPMSYADWYVRPNAGMHGMSSQPDWVAFEDCSMLRVDSGHSTAHWHDVPCSLGKHSLPANKPRKTSWKQQYQYSNAEEPPVATISSFICKMRGYKHPEELDPVPLYLKLTPNLWQPIKIATEKYFMCNNGEVISVVNVCNGHQDCRDASDETQCGLTCGEASFRCLSGRCVSVGFFCDFQDNCGDNSDEISCDHIECKRGEFRCKSGQCIEMRKRCDLLPDCNDGSDERDCQGRCNEQVTFQCYDGTCIPRNAVCDGHRDCPGKYHEDEQEGCYLSREEDRLGLEEEKKKCDNKPRRTCEELFIQNEVRETGYYLIDPDGAEGPTPPFKVHCIMGITVDDVRTVIHHDSEDRIYVRQSPFDEWIYNRTIIYDVGFPQIEALTKVSYSCRQYVKWECMGAPLGFSTGKPTSWWVDRHGKTQHYWGSAIQNLSCSCYPSCNNRDFRCNCDTVEKFQWAEDFGYLTNKSVIPVKTLFFGNTFDTGQAGFHTIGPLECFKQILPTEECDSAQNYMRCRTGHFVDISTRCLYGFDQFGFQTGCRDVSHLRNCGNFTCPEGYVKCSESYCIPQMYICDGKWDCVQGEDEINCREYLCPGQYKCNNQSACVALEQLCDGIRNCRYGDDEHLCNFICPTNCQCVGYYVRCVEKNLRALPSNLSPKTRKLDFSLNHLDMNQADFSAFQHLGELILQYNRLTLLPSNKFTELKNLYLLDLRNNRIFQIETAAFSGLKNVRFLHLENNPILSEIDPGAFVGLQQLTFLNLSGMALTGLKRNTFVGLRKVTTLNLKNNRIRYVQDGAFQDLKSVTSLYIQGNDIAEFSNDMFDGLNSLKSLFSESFKFCCIASPQVSFDYCWPPKDEISSCEDLMSSPLQRSFLWVLGIIALTGNIFVITWRIKTNDNNRVGSTLILSLSCADLLMGIYLTIIASVDIYFRGRYIHNSDSWRRSTLCKISGFLSATSSEASIFTLLFITLDRLICISFPFSMARLSLRATYQLIAVSWSLAILLALLPLMVHPYFHGEFYARSGVCLALHLTNQKPAGWQYSVAVFFCVNLVVFLIIVVAYGYMYMTIRRSSTAVSRARHKKSSTVGRQMALIVFTNSLCWFPMMVLGFMAISGARVPGEAYAWTAVFVLPVNSAMNPLIYTIASLRFNSILNWVRTASKKQRKVAVGGKLSASFASGSTNGTLNRREPLVNRKLRPPYGYRLLMDYLRTESISARQLLRIAISICEMLVDIHSTGYALGGINIESVFIQPMGENAFHTYVPDINAYRVNQANIVSADMAYDIQEYGTLVKRMLRLYFVRRNHPKLMKQLTQDTDNSI